MTINQLKAEQSVAIREKYGRCPAVERSWDPKVEIVKVYRDGRVKITSGSIVEVPCKALKGRKGDEIPQLPDFTKMSMIEKVMTAENRQDYRRRVWPLLGRRVRKLNYSKNLHDRFNLKRIPKESNGDR